MICSKIQTQLLEVILKKGDLKNFSKFTGKHLYLYAHIICPLKYSQLRFRGGYRTAATSKMKHFVIIVNGWKPVHIITKSSILDVTAVLDRTLRLFTDFWWRKHLIRMCPCTCVNPQQGMHWKTLVTLLTLANDVADIRKILPSNLHSFNEVWRKHKCSNSSFAKFQYILKQSVYTANEKKVTKFSETLFRNPTSSKAQKRHNLKDVEIESVWEDSKFVPTYLICSQFAHIF